MNMKHTIFAVTVIFLAAVSSAHAWTNSHNWGSEQRQEPRQSWSSDYRRDQSDRSAPNPYNNLPDYSRDNGYDWNPHYDPRDFLRWDR